MGTKFLLLSYESKYKSTVYNLSSSVTLVNVNSKTSNKISKSNLAKAYPNFNDDQKNQIIQQMWFNYGKIFAEYSFIKNFRKSL